MAHSIKADIAAVQAISSVPTMMRVISETTGLGWVCISRVTPDSWTMCAVRDQLGFGLVPGDNIEIAHTFCDQVRRLSVGVVIDDVSNDPVYRSHPVPKMFGFESYFSIPVHRSDGTFFGTLCGLDPKPARLSEPKTLDMLKLFAELLSGQIESEMRLLEAERSLTEERETAELREQFIAVLGHDIRTPLSAMLSNAELLQAVSGDPKVHGAALRLRRSGARIASLIDDVMDFTRGKMGGALPVKMRHSHDLGEMLENVLAELREAYPGCDIVADIAPGGPVHCDPKRLAQLLSNLAVNAIVHGQGGSPISVSARSAGGALRISVSNYGPAIPAEVAARLFQPFWRGRGGSNPDGLGLGLYIASEIARSHGGALTVDSTAERTIFSFAGDASIAQ